MKVEEKAKGQETQIVLTMVLAKTFPDPISQGLTLKKFPIIELGK